TFYFFGEYYLRTTANDDFDPVYHAVKQDVTAAGYPTVYNNFTDAGSGLDHLSVYDWIEARVPGAAGDPNARCQRSALGKLQDVPSNVEFGAETNTQSSLNLLYALAFQTIPGNFPTLRRSNERYHLVGGSERLPCAIAAPLPADSIQTETFLTSIAKNTDGTYTLGLKRG